MTRTRDGAARAGALGILRSTELDMSGVVVISRDEHMCALLSTLDRLDPISVPFAPSVAVYSRRVKSMQGWSPEAFTGVTS